MRIGGAFPFPVSDLQFGGGVIALPSGGIFYPPAGEYIYSTGAVTQIQTFDPVQGIWREQGVPDASSIAQSFDGYNWRFINLSGTINGAVITNAGSGATANGIGAAATGVTIGFGAPSAGITATGYAIVGGAVVAPTVANGGSGFFLPPTVVIDPPALGGIQATATATVSAGGAITAITMVNPGAGYASVPNFYLIPQFSSYPGATVAGVAAGIIPPPGLVLPSQAPPTVQPLYFPPGTVAAQLSPATLTGSLTLTGIGMIQNGSNYTGTTIPAVTIIGCGAAAATAIGNFTMISVTLGAGGASYTGAAPLWISSLGQVSSASGVINNNDQSASPATGTTTISGGAVATFVVEDNGFGFQKVPQIAIMPVGSIPTVIATGTAVVGGIPDTLLLQTKISD